MGVTSIEFEIFEYFKSFWSGSGSVTLVLRNRHNERNLIVSTECGSGSHRIHLYVPDPTKSLTILNKKKSLNSWLKKIVCLVLRHSRLESFFIKHNFYQNYVSSVFKDLKFRISIYKKGKLGSGSARNELDPRHYLIFKARFPLEQSYKTELKELYGGAVELVPLDFTRPAPIRSAK